MQQKVTSMKYFKRTQYFGLSMLLNRLEGRGRIDHVKRYVPFVNENINRRNCRGKTILIRAIKGEDDENNVEVIRALLFDKNFNVNYPDDHDSCPLFYAINNIHNSSTIKFLLEKGANPNTLVSRNTNLVGTSQRMTMFSYYLEKINGVKIDVSDVIQTFIERGADLNFSSGGFDPKPTVLMQLVSLRHTQHIALVADLITKGLIDFEDNMPKYENVLKICMQNSADDCIILRELGSLPMAPRLTFNFFLEMATNPKTIFLINLIGAKLSNRMSLVKILMMNYRHHLYPVVQAVLYNEIDINEKDADKHGYLDYCVMFIIIKHNKEVIKLLLNLGIDSYFSTKRVHLRNSLPIDDDIHDLLNKIELEKACKQRVLAEIRESHGVLTMHPSSLFARILSIKWRFQQEDYREVYQETLSKDPALIAYINISDAASFYLKIMDLS